MGRRKIIGVILLLFLISISSVAQTKISGKVIDSQNKEPIARVIIKLIQVSNNQILAFSQTNKLGEFSLNKVESDEACILKFSYVGYTIIDKEIPRSNYVEVSLVKNDIQLREVVIRPEKIRQNKDTVTYVVAGFATANDRTIEDVLKKMPGIEVSESGEIRYQGQKLNKFYIENSDLLGGRYALATQNISHKDVASVEVLENHQPIRALEDIGISVDPAINIKLKEDAKLRWVGTAKLGGGAPSLWNAELMGMRFRKKTQSLNTYKGNNTGNMSYDMQLFIPNGDFGAWNEVGELPAYIDVKPSYASGIGSNRNRFERKHSFTTNNLIKISKDYDLSPQIIASYNRGTSDYSSMTTYFFDNDEYTVEEKEESSKMLQKSIEGKLQLKGNKQRFYLNNTLSFNLNWNDTDVNISGTYPNTQTANITHRKISNDFSILKRIGNKSISLKSLNDYVSKPQSLIITKNNNNKQYQDIDLSSFFSKNSIEYGFYISKIRVKLDGELLYNNRWMSNILDVDKNTANFQKLKISFTPSFEYKKDVLSINLRLPVFYQYLYIKGQSNDVAKINPSIRLNYEPDSRWTMFLSGAYSTELPNEKLFYEGNILSNYRTMNSGYINFDLGNYYYTSAGIKYKNVLKLFFADASVTLSSSQNKKMSNQYFVNDIIVYDYFPSPVTNKSINVGGSVSKGFDWLKGTITVRPSWNRGEKTLIRNNVKLPYDDQSYSVRTKINSNVLNWCNLVYNFNLSYNEYKIDGKKNSNYNNFSQSFTADFFLTKTIQFKYRIEHFRNQLDDKKHKNFTFSDITASYLMGTRWEFSCYVKNMFNQKRYSYFTESDLISNRQEYKIRGTDILLNAIYRF